MPSFSIQDCVIFSLLQILFLVLIIYAYLNEHCSWFRKDGADLELKRGDLSWQYFYLAYGLLSIIFLEAINTTDVFKGYKTIITIFDLSGLVYLCFFSSWFRNKIIFIIDKSKNKIEK